MAGSVKWYGDEIQKKLEKGLRMRLRAAGEYLRAKTVRNISKPTRTLGPSNPGEYPHADTGRLRQSIYSGDMPGGKLAVFVGTNVIYGKIHETGDRPFLRRTLKEQQKAVERIVVGVSPGFKKEIL